MKTKECPACAMQVAETSKKCPICAYEFTSSGARIRWAAMLLVVMFLLYLILR